MSGHNETAEILTAMIEGLAAWEGRTVSAEDVAPGNYRVERDASELRNALVDLRDFISLFPEECAKFIGESESVGPILSYQVINRATEGAVKVTLCFKPSPCLTNFITTLRTRNGVGLRSVG